ncbi:MAG TPA: type II 3-dehydroquinate dehydratase [Candidatus Spyradocola merdavium]|nr:type II 3-dehydroquinate dehydratase [Candidatus Spyradocola merdavium]
MKFLILNGPNLNLLGLREPDIYGRQTYADLAAFVQAVCAREGIECEVRQSNHEGVLVDWIQEAYGKFDGIVMNPAAYTHTSVALLDALKAVSLPAAEVHLSNIYDREDFRHISYPGKACVKTVYGKGFAGYEEAICFLKNYIQERKETR